MIRLLVKAGTKVDSPDDLRLTALSYAALGFRPGAIKTLHELGANPNHKDSFGLTPYDHTKEIENSSALLKGR